MKPEELVEFAERVLASDDQGEADWRAAAHACYYAIYHISAKYFLLDTTHAGAGHATIRDRLKACPPSTSMPRHVLFAKRAIQTLWQLRVFADYHPDRSFTADEADQALGLAQRVVGALRH